MVIELVSSKLELNPAIVENIYTLVKGGATIPFIARYRKEMTGSLDEIKIREVVQELEKMEALETRKEKILSSLKERNLLSDDLKELILCSSTMAELEAIYSPYKSARKTLGQKAREKGMDRVVVSILSSPKKTNLIIKEFSERNSIDTSEVEEGIVHILAEKMAYDPQSRDAILNMARKKGEVSNKIIPVEKRKAKKGYEGQEDKESQISSEELSIPIRKFRPHQIQAFQKAERRGQIRTSWNLPEKEIQNALMNVIPPKIRQKDPKLNDLVSKSALSSYKRLVKPSITRQMFRELVEDAERHAINIFSSNLRNLLMHPPLKGKRILGLDPGLRTGTKVAAIDEKGDVLFTGTLNTLNPEKAELEIKKIITEYRIDFLALGNGTGSRDVETILKKVVKDCSCDYSIVSEAGASVYSASEIAQEEFPDIDVSIRGAISIARRLQDPLAELIKIDPRSLGIGQYQHDIDPKKLEKALEAILEEVVNTVGVDVNTATWPLLAYVSGLTKTTAKSIVEFRRINGSFRNRETLKQVKGVGLKTFEQCAGFLRIFNGENPLDATHIHPESYSVALTILKRINIDLKDLLNATASVSDAINSLSPKNIDELASNLGVGKPTLIDILDALTDPLKDPRGKFKKITFDQHIKSIDDLEPGIVLQAEVRNVTDFGVFVDIGVKRDALIHISELAERFVRHPSDIVSVGDRLNVRIIDVKNGRISASLKGIDQLQKDN